MNRQWFATCSEEHGFNRERSGLKDQVEWYGVMLREEQALY